MSEDCGGAEGEMGEGEGAKEDGLTGSTWEISLQVGDWVKDALR